MYPSNFRNFFLLFSMRTSQSTNKMVANDSRPKLTIRDVSIDDFSMCFFMRGVEGDADGA